MVRDDVGKRLLWTKKRDYERDTVLMRVTNIIRNETFKKHYTFTGSLIDEQYISDK